MSRYLPLSASLALAISSLTAAAQNTDKKPSLQLKEVTVTATRREASLSDTPVAISAFSGDQLLQSGVADPTGIADFAHNVSIDRNNGGLQINIRGIVSNDTTERGDPSVSFLLDDVVIARMQAQEVSFLTFSVWRFCAVRRVPCLAEIRPVVRSIRGEF